MDATTTAADLAERRIELARNGIKTRRISIFPGNQIEVYHSDIDLIPDNTGPIRPLYFRRELWAGNSDVLAGPLYQATTLHLSLYENGMHAFHGVTGFRLENGEPGRFSPLTPPSGLQPEPPSIVFYETPTPPPLPPIPAVEPDYRADDNYSDAQIPKLDDGNERLLRAGHQINYNSYTKMNSALRIRPLQMKRLYFIAGSGSIATRYRALAIAEPAVDGDLYSDRPSNLPAFIYGFGVSVPSGRDIKRIGIFRRFNLSQEARFEHLTG